MKGLHKKFGWESVKSRLEWTRLSVFVELV